MRQGCTLPITETCSCKLGRRTLLQGSLAGSAALLASTLLGSRFISTAFASDTAPIVETTAGKDPRSRDQRGANIQGDPLRRSDCRGESFPAAQRTEAMDRRA